MHRRCSTNCAPNCGRGPASQLVGFCMSPLTGLDFPSPILANRRYICRISRNSEKSGVDHKHPGRLSALCSCYSCVHVPKWAHVVCVPHLHLSTLLEALALLCPSPGRGGGARGTRSIRGVRASQGLCLPLSWSDGVTCGSAHQQPGHRGFKPERVGSLKATVVTAGDHWPPLYWIPLLPAEPPSPRFSWRPWTYYQTFEQDGAQSSPDQ